VTLALTENTSLGASIVVDRKSVGHTVTERSWKDADFVCITCNWRSGYGKEL
jgi:hypothetical protein